MKKWKLTAFTGSITMIFFLVALILSLTPSLSLAKDKPIQLKMSVEHGTKGGKYIRGHLPWSKKVEEATKGKIKVILYPANSLSKARERVDATIDGICDIGWMALPHFPNRFPLTESFQFPGLGFNDALMASKMAWHIYKKFPEIQKEWEHVKVLLFHALAPMVLATPKKRVTTVAEVKGMKLRVAGKAASSLYKAAGASPIFVPPADIFLNLQKGVMDGAVIGWEGLKSFGVTKLSKYFIPVLAHPAVMFAVIMNKEKWNSLPPDVQKDLWSVCDDFGAAFYGAGDDKSVEIVLNDLRKQGKEINAFSPEESAKWMALAKGLRDKMIADLEKRGLPAQAVYEEMARQSK
jgi:TRAP-type C4-dicarboxylate transport system substrate-binding protein